MKRLLLSVAVLVICGNVEQAPGANWTITRLTDNDYSDQGPRVSGANVVWHGDGMKVFLYDGIDTHLISERGGGSIQVDGSKVVWAAGDVFIYDVNDGTTVQVPGSTSSLPQVSGSNVVWDASDGHDHEIFLYDGAEVIQLTDNDCDDYSPQVSGENVVWQRRCGSSGHYSDSEIFLYDGTMTTQLTDNTFDDTDAQVSGSNVVWVGNAQIFFYDGTTTIPICDNSVNNMSPQVDGSRVAWLRTDGHNYQAFLYDGRTTKQLSFVGASYPQISGTNVVWACRSEVFLYDGVLTTQITDEDANQKYHPMISGSNVVWFGDTDDGEDGEIFLANVIPTIPGDVNLDGQVNDADAAVLAAFWQYTDVGWYQGDFTADGCVTDADAAILATHWQEGVEGGASVPKPSMAIALLSMAVGLLAYSWRRRKRAAGSSNGC